MFWLRAFCCARPPKDCDVERPWVGGVLDKVRLASCNSWHVSAAHDVEALRAAMGSSSHVSIFGASVCGSALVALAGSGPSSCAPMLSVGQVLPSPWSPAAATNNTKHEKSSRATLKWMVGLNGGAAKIPAREDSEAWSTLRSRLLASMGPETGPMHLLLIPLELGSQLVGALLCAESAEALMKAPQLTPTASPASMLSVVPPPATAPVALEEPHAQAHISSAGGLAPAAARSGGGGGHGRSGGDGGDSDVLKLHASPAAARAVTAVLVDCLFAPHLRNVQQVCTAAYQLTNVGDICALAAVISSAVAESLRAELHLDLQVRVAVATAAAAAASAAGGGGAGPLQYGFLLQLRPPSMASQNQTPQSTWQLQSVDALQLQQHASQAVPPAVPLAAVPRLAAAAMDGRGSPVNSQTRQGRTPYQQLTNDGRTGLDVPSRSESFLFVTTTDTVRLDGGMSVAPEDMPPASTLRIGGGGGGGVGSVGAGGAGAGAIGRLLMEYTRDRRAWKAVPFAMSTSLLGDVLRDDAHARGSIFTLPTGSSYYCTTNGYMCGSVKGGMAPGGRAGLLPSGAACRSHHSGGAPLVAPAPPQPGRVRLTSTVLQDLHVYLQEVDQPGSDVFLLFGNSRRGSAAGAAPACLVLLSAAGGAGTPAGGNGNSTSRALRPGLSGEIGPLRSTPEDAYDDVYGDMYGVCSGGGGGGGGGGGSGGGGGGAGCTPRPHLALFITSQDRLPASLLRAARDVGQRLLEMLLPSALDSLTWGPSALELAEMNLLIETRAAQGSCSSWAPPGRRDSGPCSALSPPVSSNSGIHRLGTKHRIPSNASSTTAASAPTTPLDATATAATAAAAAISAAAAAADAPAGRTLVIAQAQAQAVRPSPTAAPAPAPLLPRQPLRKFSSRISMLGRTTARTAASMGDSRDGFVPDSPHSSGGVRRMAAELVASVLSPFTTTTASAASSVTASLSTVPRQGSLTATGGGVELSFGGVGGAALGGRGSAGGSGLPDCSSGGGGGVSFSSVSFSMLSSLPHQLRARMAGMCSVGGPQPPPRAPRRSVTELLDLEGLGADMRVGDVPNIEMLLASMYSTLNDVDADPSPYAADDLRFLRLTRVIGNGGCSTVYAGRLLGLEVAVKLLEPFPEGALGALQPQAEAAEAEATGGKRPQTQEQGQQQQQDKFGDHTQQQLPPQQQLRARWAAARQARLKDLMRGARELAVLSSISHPNIVQVYSYHTNVMVVHGPSQTDLPKLLPVGHQKHQQQPANGGGPMHVAIVMECCDMGSLADALDSGRFKDAIIRAATAARSSGAAVGLRRTNSTLDRSRVALAAAPAATAAGDRSMTGRCGSITAQSSGGGVAMRAIYLTLLEVALALRHMHSRNLVHCDVKSANVLLKSSTSDPRGFTCKLGDFGLVGIVRKDSRAAECVSHNSNQEGAVGTITHLAPEYFSPGTRLDFSLDMYAFGIVMWEVFTSKPPYMEHATRGFKDLPCCVVNEGLRPRWPAHTPVPYRSLASACWAADPVERPTAASVVAMLQRLMET